MERDNYNPHTDSLVRRITEERERFVSAWQHGAAPGELNQIRQSIQRLNELLWNASTNAERTAENSRGARENERNIHTRTGPASNT